MSDVGKYGTMPGLQEQQPEQDSEQAQRIVDKQLAEMSELTVYRVSADEPVSDGCRARYYATRGEAEEAHEALSAESPDAEFDAIEPVTVRSAHELAQALNDAVSYGDAS